MDCCHNCGSKRLFTFGGKCSDMGWFTFGDKEKEGYAPDVNSLCNGDYIEGTVCMECGTLQSSSGWPKPDPILE